MVSVIFIGLFALIGLGALVTTFIVKPKNSFKTNPKVIAGSVAASALVLSLLTWVISSSFIVEARTVGIVTEFGQATGVVQPGYYFLPPWATVTEFPTSNQPLDLNSLDDNKEGRPIKVKFDGGGTGYVHANVNWKVRGNDEAIKLWEEWKDFDKVTNQVVSKEVITEAADITGAYEPQEAVRSVNYNKIADAIKKNLNTELAGKGIKINEVNVMGIDVDDATQARINKQAAAKADIVTAQANQERAVIDNETKRMTQDSLTPAALTDQCLKMVNSWDVNKNGNLPAGFSCFGGVGLPLSVPVR
jgi:regulator of protease activity HflC (stomatin/prohibitin superfamily)